jgi:hypothetical protein
LKVAKETIPNKVVTVRPDDKPWFTNDLRRLLHVKNKSYRKAKNHNTPEFWASFRHNRNKYYQEIERSKQNYEANKYASLVIEDRLNSKNWWHILKGILGQTHDSIIPPLNVDNNIITNDKGKANAFNDYFASASKLDDSNHRLPEEDDIEVEVLDSISVTEREVCDQLCALDVTKAYGPDGVPPRLLKEARYVISKPLALLFNKSLNQCTFPNIWKLANILPILKKGEKNRVCNYRPVSLLSANLKIF